MPQNFAPQQDLVASPQLPPFSAASVSVGIKGFWAHCGTNWRLAEISLAGTVRRMVSRHSSGPTASNRLLDVPLRHCAVCKGEKPVSLRVLFSQSWG